MLIPVISGGNGGSSATCEAFAIAVIRARPSSRRRRTLASTTASTLTAQTAVSLIQ